MKRIASIAAAAVLVLCVAHAVAQDRYPSRPIELINPYPPGGGVDVLLRALAEPLQRTLHQPVVITHRVGAGGATGTAWVANAAPDGYAVVVVASSFVTIPEFDKLFKRVPAYTTDQLIGVALFSVDVRTIGRIEER